MLAFRNILRAYEMNDPERYHYKKIDSQFKKLMKSFETTYFALIKKAFSNYIFKNDIKTSIITI